MEHTIGTPTTSTTPAQATALGLSHILPGLLPATVHTPLAPERYTVSAVFTQRPTASEVAALDGDAAHAWLAEAGFPLVSLKVSDRRLEISNTSLEELAGGLAAAVAGLLARLSVEDDARTLETTTALARLERRERLRWESVRTAVDRIELRDASAATDAAAPLGLRRIAAELLPTELATVTAPARYTVTADLTRQPTPTESAILAEPRSQQRLHDAGYPAARLVLRDRRLEIQDTSLTELGAGLAAAVSDLLFDVGVESSERDVAAAAEALRHAENERQRADSVAAAAAAIVFTV